MAVAELDLDLDVFAGPFDLLLAVVLREEVSLLELQLGEVVVAYVEHLAEEEELELEVATEFLVLIAALLELKSRLLLPGPEEGLEEMGPEEAVEELLARMLEYRRYSRCRRSCGGSRSTPPTPSMTPTCSARRSATCWSNRRRSTSVTSARPSRCSGGWRRSATPSAAAPSSTSTTSSAARTG